MDLRCRPGSAFPRRRAAGGKILEIKDYEEILNAIPDTGIYVIREDDRSLLYYNKRCLLYTSDAADD